MARSSYETANGILAAARERGLDERCFHQLPGWRALPLLDSIFDTFTVLGRGGREQRWIWNDLREPSWSLQGDESCQLLNLLGPPSTPVWLIAEDASSRTRGVPFWAFEATLSAAAATLDNHHLLEFFVVSRSMSWLCGQNHHAVWFAVGDHAVALLRHLSR